MPLAKISSARSRISSLVTVLLMTRRRRSDPVSGAIVMVRSPLAVSVRTIDSVRSSRRSDAGVIAQRDRHQPDTARVGARRARQLEDAVGWKRSDREVVVASPAEPAQVRA